MTFAGFIAGTILGAYFVGGFSLWAYVEALRSRGVPKGTLPHPLAFFGPSSWAYAFSGRHRALNDRALTSLVLLWRTSIALLPIGIWAFFASAT